MHVIQNAIHNGEIGNALSTPGFEHRVGKIVNGREIKAIVMSMENEVSHYNVYWKLVDNRIMVDHKSYV